jgi:hypothetical protein
VSSARAVARALLAFAVVGATPASARAATPIVTLLVDACPTIDEARLRSLVDIELGAIVGPSPSGAGVGYEARLHCAGDVVTIELRRRALPPSAAGGSRAELDLGSTAESTRLRVLALAITEELALDARTDVAPAPAPVPGAPSPVPTLTAGPTPAAPRESWGLFARGSARRAAHPALWLAGAGVGVERALSPRLVAALDVTAENGEAATSLATVSVRDLVATAGLSVGATAGRWSGRAGPAFSVALARLAATPRDAGASGSTLSATWAGPSLAGRVECALARRMFLLAEASGGLTTRKVTGLVDGQSTLFALAGPWLSMGLGAGASF